MRLCNAMCDFAAYCVLIHATSMVHELVENENLHLPFLSYFSFSLSSCFFTLFPLSLYFLSYPPSLFFFWSPENSLLKQKLNTTFSSASYVKWAS